MDVVEAQLVVLGVVVALCVEEGEGVEESVALGHWEALPSALTEV